MVLILDRPDTWYDQDLVFFLLGSPDWEDWLRTSHDFKYIETGETVPFGQEREEHVLMYRIARGQLQDCWELYQTKVPEWMFKPQAGRLDIQRLETV